MSRPEPPMSDPSSDGFFTTVTDPEDFDRYMGDADGWSDGD